jgi:hypothetical protein
LVRFTLIGPYGAAPSSTEMNPSLLVSLAMVGQKASPPLQDPVNVLGMDLPQSACPLPWAA